MGPFQDVLRRWAEVLRLPRTLYDSSPSSSTRSPAHTPAGTSPGGRPPAPAFLSAGTGWGFAPTAGGAMHTVLPAAMTVHSFDVQAPQPAAAAADVQDYAAKTAAAPTNAGGLSAALGPQHQQQGAGGHAGGAAPKPGAGTSGFGGLFGQQGSAPAVKAPSGGALSSTGPRVAPSTASAAAANATTAKAGGAAAGSSLPAWLAAGGDSSDDEDEEGGGAVLPAWLAGGAQGGAAAAVSAKQTATSVQQQQQQEQAIPRGAAVSPPPAPAAAVAPPPKSPAPPSCALFGAYGVGAGGAGEDEDEDDEDDYSGPTGNGNSRCFSVHASVVYSAVAFP